MSDIIEQAVREAINELEYLVSRYTIAHPENTMRVLGLLWEDQRRIADYLRRSLDAYDELATEEEWGVQVMAVDEYGDTHQFGIADVDRAHAESRVKRVDEPPNVTARLVRRYVTPWEVVTDE